MKQVLARLKLDRVNWNYVLAGVALVIAVVFLWRTFDVSDRLAVRSAVADLLADNRPEVARRKLLDIGDRALVLAALKEALEGEDGSVRGKIQVAQTLLSPSADYGWNEARPVHRALSSGVTAARRAAAYVLVGQDAFGAETEKTAIEWLRDGSASDRSLCFTILQQRRPKEVVPDLLAILRAPARSPEEIDVLRKALSTLQYYKPEGLGAEVLALGCDAARSPDVRIQAFKLLARLEDADSGKTRDTMIRLLLDRNESAILRGVLAGELAGKAAFAGDATYDALEQVLLDPDSSTAAEFATQRACLRAGQDSALPLDRLRRLVHDRRVYGHKYFGIRSDACTAMAPLGMRDRVSFDILCSALVDDDAADRAHVVRLEAWISLWMLTERPYGIGASELFLRPPPIPAEPRREALLSYSLRRGISPEQMLAIDRLVGDLEACKRARATFESTWNEIEADRKKKAEATAQGAKKEGEPSAPAKESPPGTPPESPATPPKETGTSGGAGKPSGGG